MNVDIESLRKALHEKDGAAFIGLADALEEAGCEHSGFFSELAYTIQYESDQMLQWAAAAMFLDLVERLGYGGTGESKEKGPQAQPN